MDPSSTTVDDRKVVMLNLNDLYFFVQVVDRKGFAAAGRALGVPKSSLSKRVAELEQHLGVTLIQRTSRSFVVTDIGKEFYRHAAAMQIEAEAAQNVVKRRLTEPSGTVRVTASVATAQMSLSTILPELAQHYPKIQIVLHATNRFVDIAQEGFDIAVRAHYRSLPDSDLVQRSLGSSPNYLVASPRYLERRNAAKRPEDIALHDGLLTAPAPQAPIWSLKDANGEIAHARPVPRFYADEPLTLLNAAKAGLGIACLPHGLCWRYIEEGTLVQVLPEWQADGATTTILTPRRRGQLASVRVVIDFLADALRRSGHNK